MMISEAEIEAALDAYLGSKLWRTSAGVPGYRDAMRAALSAASAAREASGLVLVPMDPTEAMDPAEAMLAARKGSLNKMRAQSPRFSHGVKRALFAPCK
jgi:hypothetical protein